MAKYLKEFALYDETDTSRDLKTQQRLTNESRCILANFEKQFSKYQNNQNAWKIGIDVVKSKTQQKPIVVGGCVEAQIIFDLEHYFNAENLDKKKMILEMLWEGIVLTVKTFKWDILPFQNAKDAVLRTNYMYHWIWKKPKLNPSKRYKAEIFCEHEIDFFRISLVAKDKNDNILKTIHLIDEEPNEFIFAKYFGSFDWISENEISFSSKDGSISWVYNINKDFLSQK